MRTTIDKRIHAETGGASDPSWKARIRYAVTRVDQASIAAEPARLHMKKWFARILVSVGLGTLVTSTLVILIAPATADVVAPTAMMAANVIAGVVFIGRSSRLPVAERRAFRSVGAGVLVAALGLFAFGLQLTVVGEAPAFGPLDGFFVSGYVFLIAGVSMLPELTGDWRQRARVAIDGLVGTLSISALVWALIVEKIVVDLAGRSTVEIVTGALYPVLDMVMLAAMAIAVVRRRAFHFDIRLIVLGSALCAQAAADFGYALSGVGKSFGQADPNYFLFMATAGLTLTAAALVDRLPVPRDLTDRRPPWWSIIVPYGASAAAFALLTVRIFSSQPGRPVRLLFVVAVAVAVLIVIRQLVAIRENGQIIQATRNSLVSSISHELRTPMTSLLGFLALIDDDDEAILSEQEKSELVTVCREQATYMARMVQDLTMLARYEPADLDLVDEECLVAELVSASWAAVEGGSVNIETEVPADLIVLVDRHRTQQILVNFMTNARRYGGDRMLIRVVAAGSDMVIEIHDNGPGVPSKYQVSIWDRFERGDQALRAKTPGSGIGLAVVAAITRAYHGKIGYRTSELLGGACFSVLLPDRIETAGSLDSRSGDWAAVPATGW